MAIAMVSLRERSEDDGDAGPRAWFGMRDREGLSPEKHFDPNNLDPNPTVWVPPPASNSLTPARCPAQFLSTLTLSTWREHQIPQAEGSVPQVCPHFNANHKYWVPRVPTSVRVGYKVRSFHNIPFRFSNLPEQLTELRKLLYLLSLVYYKGYR